MDRTYRARAAKAEESRAAGSTNDSKVGKGGSSRANKGGLTGEPKEVRVDASTQGPKARREGDEGTSESGRDATTGERGDTPAWDTADDTRGRGADRLGRGTTDASAKDKVEGQEG